MATNPLNFQALEPVNNEGYGTWALPCQRDDELDALVRALTAGTADSLEGRHVPVLLAFAERMATLARRETSPERLRIGLAAAGLASSVGDQREVVAVLSLLWRTTEALGLRADEEFRSAAGRLTTPRVLIDFAQRDPQDRAIEAMGYVEVEDELGFRYERTW